MKFQCGGGWTFCAYVEAVWGFNDHGWRVSRTQEKLLEGKATLGTGAGRAGRQVKFAEYLSHARHQARDFLIYAPPFFSFVSQVLPSENISISFIPEVDMEASPREAQ